MKKKLINWTKQQEQDFKKIILGTIIITPILFISDVKIGIFASVITSLFLTAILINSYRFFRKIFKDFWWTYDYENNKEEKNENHRVHKKITKKIISDHKNV